MQDVVVALFRLPSGKVAYQRRDYNAIVEPGNLGFFGGAIEGDETPDQAIQRELAEETSLNVSSLTIRRFVSYPHPYAPNSKDIHMYLVDIPDSNFAVYEGKSLEVYDPQALVVRHDVIPGTRIGTTYYLMEQKDV